MVAVGNALVDVLTQVDEQFIIDQQAEGMKKGAMILIDTPRAKDLYRMMGVTHEMSGGSAANSVSGFASFGGQGAFIGKVGEDRIGHVFRADMNAQGIAYNTPSFVGAEETGRCYIMITPDGERTMNTYLGTNLHFRPRDVDEAMVRNAQYALLEGYLFDRPDAKRAFEKVARVGKPAGTQIAMTLSDSFCVERHHADFKRIVQDSVDVLFASEKEIKAYALTQDFEEAARIAAADVHTAVLTRGAKGAVILSGGQRFDIAAIKPKKFVDTTGAGDAFAGGVLYGLSEGMSLDKCGRLGAMAATVTISHTGGRSPDVRFRDLLPRL
jgi:sugar/nucleoside kinase (ribokinase family)